MEFFEQVEEIRNAKEQGKLVVFVGAGVSKNSGLPSWEGLIHAFAESLGYKPQRIVSKTGKESNHFCSDEYLKIPQHVYNNRPEEYTKLLEMHFGEDALHDKKPNNIHELIYDLSPAHIITTNYDSFIEKCVSEKRLQYTVVSSDKELLEEGKSSKRLILKMHGDYRDLKNIVLKEDDYLRYEQEHILISTYIKSLLVNHTFLFVGYSINDYNFKQIIDWIVYLSAQVKAEKPKMPTHFVIRTGSDKIRKYEKVYLEKKRIELVAAEALPNDYIEQANTENCFTKAHAKQLYAVLKAVIDPMADIHILGSAEALHGRLSIFNDFKYIPYPSLIKILNLDEAYAESVVLESKNDDVRTGDLLFGYHWLLISKDSDSFSLLKTACEEIPEIQNYFVGADFYGVREYDHDNSFAFSSTEKSEDETWDLFVLYLNNDYSELLERVDSSSNKKMKSYYKHSLHMQKPKSDYEDLKELAYSTGQTSAFLRLIDKINWLSYSCQWHRPQDERKQARQSVVEYFESLNESQRKAIDYIYDWFINSRSSQLSLDCLSLLEKQEAFYSIPDISKTNPYEDLSKIAKTVLCFYKFIKLNHVLLDHLKETRDLFWAYTKAVLITYKPQNKFPESSMFTSAAETHPVKIDEFMLDIIVKYSNYKSLNSYINKHCLSAFNFSSNNDAAKKFFNLCASKESLPFNKFEEYLKNFCALLRRCELSEEYETQIINAYANFDQTFLTQLFEDALANGARREIAREFLLLLANFSIKQSCAWKVIERFISAVEKDKKAKMVTFLIYNMFSHSPQFIKDKICELISEHEDSFDAYEKIELIVNDLLTICEGDINEIRNIVNSIVQKKNNGISSFPDCDKLYIDMCLRLKLSGKIEDISFLEPAKEKYSFLKCVFEPETFDVTTINFRESIWREIFEKTEYREKMLSVNNNREQIKGMLIKILNNGNAGVVENQIFFRHFF